MKLIDKGVSFSFTSLLCSLLFIFHQLVDPSKKRSGWACSASPLLCCCPVVCTICASCMCGSPSFATLHAVMAERKRSFVWSYFTAINKKVAICDVCRNAVHLTTPQTSWNQKKKKNEKENMEEERNGSSATRLQTLRQSSFRDPNNILSPLDLSTLIILTKMKRLLYLKHEIWKWLNIVIIF